VLRGRSALPAMLAAVTSFVVGADASMACGVVARGAQVRVRVDALDGAQELLNMRSEISHDLSSAAAVNRLLGILVAVK
jgi:hypothetical protein